MAVEQEKVSIRLQDVGEQEQAVLAVLAKIQGLNDAPELLIAHSPCYIADNVPQNLAEKVKMYLERAGALVELETFSAEGNGELFPFGKEDDLTLPLADRPGYQVEEMRDSHETSVSPPDDASTTVKPPPLLPVPPAKRLGTATKPPRQFPEISNVNVFEEPPRKRPRSIPIRKRRSLPAIAAIAGVVLVAGVGLWLYLSGGVDNLSQRYEQSPMVGQVGTLLIENPVDASLRLFQVVGTRVTQQSPLEGTRALLKRGDYYLEAQHDEQIARFPVYISGRGHKVTVTIAFPAQQSFSRDIASIPAGWFRMGNKPTNITHFGFPDELPDIDVYVNEFSLSRYEVTNRQYNEFVAASGYYTEAYWERLIQDWDSLVQQVPAYGQAYGNNGWGSVRKYIHTRFINTDDRPSPRLWEIDEPPYDWGQDDYPVVGVTFYEADAFCKWKTAQTGKLHRLPTEAEWEKAARGYEGYFFSYGNEYDATRANTESEGPRRVGTYPPNSYGLYDMTGNVWEWVSDQYGAETYSMLADEYADDIRNPHHVDLARRYNRVVVRGGSFRSVNRINARTTVRYPMFPNDWHTNIGFRYVVVP